MFDFFKNKKRGLVECRFMGEGLINKGRIWEGLYEVEIIEETNEYYKIHYVNPPGYHQNEWIKKERVELLNK